MQHFLRNSEYFLSDLIHPNEKATAEMLGEQSLPSNYIWLIDYLFSEVLGDTRISKIPNAIEKVLRRKPKGFSDYDTKLPLLVFETKQ